ncbi:MAG: zinc-dependent peptidase [Nannocystaceae bacterium]|nr:zinc-dependent peptidase [Nannocystaceae bacterium]
MFFDWLRRRRRDKILAEPFDETWVDYLQRNMGCWATLTDEEQAHLRQLVQVFVAEKHWEGLGGMAMTDEVRVTIAGQACLLVLELPHDLYRRVESILVYPNTVRAPARGRSMFETSTDLADQGMPVLGQAFKRGPVMLVWDAVKRGGRNAHDGHNVVLHEFAHKLDMLTGDADGVPPLHDKATYAAWVSVFQREWDALHERQEQGRRTFLDAYAGTNPAEFFAVATEQFFEQGRTMQRKHPELYEVLQGFYRQDPAARPC